MQGQQSRAERLVDGFLRSATILLIVTAIVKVVSAISEVPVLAQRDPLLYFLTNRQVLVAAAALELGIVTVLPARTGRTVAIRLGVLSWLSCIFLAYRDINCRHLVALAAAAERRSTAVLR